MKRLLVLGIGCAMSFAAAAADYPVRPIRLVVPFAPGGPIDTMARPIAQGMSEILGQPVIVENKAGAAGNIGTEFVSRATPDGYTLLIAGGSQAINQSVYKKLSFDLSKDFTGVAMLGTGSSVMLVPASSGITTPQQFVEFAKRKPGGANFASPGAGTSTHLIAEMFKTATGVPMTHVPFRGSAPALAETIAGRVDMMFDSSISVAPFVKAGELRAIALGGRSRIDALPGVPTLRELGIDVVLMSWTGIFAPAGTPRPVLDALNATINKILAQPAMVANFDKWGNKIEPMNWPDFDAFTKSEVQRFRAVVQAAGVSQE